MINYGHQTYQIKLIPNLYLFFLFRTNSKNLNSGVLYPKNSHKIFFYYTNIKNLQKFTNIEIKYLIYLVQRINFKNKGYFEH